MNSWGKCSDRIQLQYCPVVQPQHGNQKLLLHLSTVQQQTAAGHILAKACTGMRQPSSPWSKIGQKIPTGPVPRHRLQNSRPWLCSIHCPVASQALHTAPHFCSHHSQYISLLLSRTKPSLCFSTSSIRKKPADSNHIGPICLPQETAVDITEGKPRIAVTITESIVLSCSHFPKGRHCLSCTCRVSQGKEDLPVWDGYCLVALPPIHSRGILLKHHLNGAQCLQRSTPSHHVQFRGEILAH